MRDPIVDRHDERSRTAASATSTCRTRSRTSPAPVRFDSRGVSLDEVTARLGGGPVRSAAASTSKAIGRAAST